MLRGSRRLRWWIAIAAAGVPLCAASLVVWRATRAKEEAAAEVASKSDFPYRMIPIGGQPPAGVDPIAASPGFRDVAIFHDSIAVSARAGLYLYDRGGSLTRAFRAGMELPGAELGAIETGILAGSSEPELFIGTHGQGLLAFNGSRFRQLLPNDPSMRNITAVLALPSGRLLLGTEKAGALVFDGHTLAPFQARLRSAYITALAGKEGDLWIGTLQDGLLHSRAGELEDLKAALPDPQVLSLLATDDATYAGTPLGAVEFRDGRRTRVVGDGYFARALSLNGDTLHIGTQDEGIVDVALQSRRVPHWAPESAPVPASVNRLATIEGETYAVGDGAVYRFATDAHQWKPVLTAAAPLLADRNIASLAASDGRLWVGYFDRGLDVVTAALDHATHYEDDTLFCINRIVPDAPHGRTAVATANGLAMFDAGARSRQVMGRKDGFLSDHVTDVAFRDDGMVVATTAGLSFVDRGGVRSLYAFHGLVNNHVYTVAATGTQTIAGTLGGISMLDGDAVRANYTTANSHLRHNWITSVLRVGDQWFAGTYGAGVLRMDRNGAWKAFPGLKESFVVNPNAMAASNGRVYAGSLDQGLYVYDVGSDRWSRTMVGLPSANVTAVAVSGGYLYVGTDNGLVRMAEGVVR